jgi:hypothetical protein
VLGLGLPALPDWAQPSCLLTRKMIRQATAAKAAARWAGEALNVLLAVVAYSAGTASRKKAGQHRGQFLRPFQRRLMPGPGQLDRLRAGQQRGQPGRDQPEVR